MLQNYYGGLKMLTFSRLVLSKNKKIVRECLVLCLVLSSPSGLVNSTNCRELGWVAAFAKTLQCSNLRRSLFDLKVRQKYCQWISPAVK